MGLYDFLKQPVIIFSIVLITSFYVAWKTSKYNKEASYKYYDKTFIFLFIFVLFAKITFFLFNRFSLDWNVFPIRYIEDIETTETYYELLGQLPWILFRFWDSFYFLFSSVFSIFIFSFAISKFKFGKVYDENLYFAMRLSTILILGFVISTITNNQVGDLSIINLVLIILLIIPTIILVTEKLYSTMHVLIWVFFNFILVIFELRNNINLETLFPYVIITLLTAFIILLKNVQDLKYRREDRKNTDIDLVKERANLVRRTERLNYNDFSLSYRKANASAFKGETVVAKLISKLSKNKGSSKDEDNSK